jgi:hypothetical protein
LPGEERRNIEVESATIEQSHVLENLIQLYVYDFTEYVPMTLGPDGRYEYWATLKPEIISEPELDVYTNLPFGVMGSRQLAAP